MPMFTYTPQWEPLGAFVAKMKKLLPAGYTGLAGVRLHRTGYPLTLEPFGASLPDKPLYPMALLQFKGGELEIPLAKVENDFEVPWLRKADFDRFRDDVMTFYMAEDLLEGRAEEILKADAPDEALMRKNFVDHASVPAWA